MKFTFFIGIDVSKKTIDVAIYVSANQPVLHRQFDNRPSGFKEMLAWITKYCGKQGLLFCFEHTARAAPRHLCPATMLFFYSAEAGLLPTIGFTSKKVDGHPTR